jgi:putative transcriptional regulator
MTYSIDFSVATSEQIERALCERVEALRLAQNRTQADLAAEAGIGVRTLRRLEKGDGVAFDTMIRVMIALGLQDQLSSFLPDPSVRPMERLGTSRQERQRARPATSRPAPAVAWTWGDETDNG